jgi:outer membrane protein assembly factor BamA
MTAFRGSSERFECSACVPGVNALVRRRAVRLGFNLDGSKQYGYSISREEGAAVTLTSDLDREALGADGDGTAVTLSGRVYQRAFARHAVLAARVAGAASWGDPVMRRQFQASGAGPVPPAFAFGSDAIGLMRGYENSAISGPRAFTANVDYRFPITFVQRGIGTLPFFLQSIHGAAFADFGHAWTGDFDASEVRQSFGLELSVDTVVGYWLPLTLTGGIALRDDPVAGRRDVVGFARIGKAF